MLSAANILSMSFVLALLVPVGLYIWTGDSYYIWLAVGIVLANVAVAAIKRVVAGLNIDGVSRRPALATDCDALCTDGAVGGSPGFPSGHMTTVTMTVVGLWLHWGQQTDILWLGVPWIAAVAWARWAKHCHTWAQIVGGGMFGGAAAVGLKHLHQ